MAGRSGSNTRQSGEILINGLKQKLGFGTSVRDKSKDIHIIVFSFINQNEFISSLKELNVATITKFLTIKIY